MGQTTQPTFSFILEPFEKVEEYKVLYLSFECSEEKVMSSPQTQVKHMSSKPLHWSM